MWICILTHANTVYITTYNAKTVLTCVTSCPPALHFIHTSNENVILYKQNELLGIDIDT